jgi:hypothetical protein
VAEILDSPLLFPVINGNCQYIFLMREKARNTPSANAPDLSFNLFLCFLNSCIIASGAYASRSSFEKISEYALFLSLIMKKKII